MSAASARPADLAAYARAGALATAAWRPLVPGFATAVDDLRTALSFAALPFACRPAVSGHLAGELAELALDLGHHDQWVAGVAAAFEAADAGGAHGVVAVADDAVLVVGQATRLAAEADGRRDAIAIAALLAGATGRIAGDRSVRAGLEARLAALTSIGGRLGAGANDGDYAATLVNTLGPAGVGRLLDAINDAGVAADRGLVDAEQSLSNLVAPVARVLATADRSGRVAAGALAPLSAFGPGADTDGAAYRALGLSERIAAERDADARRRAVAVLLATERFTATTTAAAAAAVLRAPAPDVASRDIGFTGAVLATHPDLALSETIALRSLVADDAALRAFVGGPGDVTAANLAPLLVPAAIVTHRYDDSGAARPTLASVDEAYRAARAGVLERALVELPAADLASSTPAPAAAGATIAAAIKAAGAIAAEARLDADVQRILAVAVTPHALSLANATDLGTSPNLPASLLDGVDRAAAMSFLTAVSFDAVARGTLLAGGAALLQVAFSGRATAIAEGRDDFAMPSAVAANYFAAMFEAAKAAGTTVEHERAATVTMLTSVISPVVEAVATMAGGVLGKTGALVSAITGSASEGLTGSIVHLVTSALLRAPLVGDVGSLASAVFTGFHQLAFDALWADDAARVTLGGPLSFTGLRPDVAEASRAHFEYPSEINRPPDGRAADVVRAIENDFLSAFASRAALAGVIDAHETTLVNTRTA